MTYDPFDTFINFNYSYSKLQRSSFSKDYTIQHHSWRAMEEISSLLLPQLLLTSLKRVYLPGTGIIWVMRMRVTTNTHLDASVVVNKIYTCLHSNFNKLMLPITSEPNLD